MKSIIFYYSATGNTKLACEYIAKNIKSTDFDLVNIAKSENVDISLYNVVGFAATADFWAPPYLMKMFIDNLPQQSKKLAFVFNTYGMYSGRTLSILTDWVQSKGFTVLAGHSLHAPENFPPLRVTGITSKNAPGPKSIKKFNQFINNLDMLIDSSSANVVTPAKIKIGFLNSMVPSRLLTTAKKNGYKPIFNMGEQYVDEKLCTECGICQKECPYKAITLDPKPVFAMDKCYGCWTCFNVCPQKAIYTKKIRGKGHYQKPPAALKEKLK